MSSANVTSQDIAVAMTAIIGAWMDMKIALYQFLPQVVKYWAFQKWFTFARRPVFMSRITPGASASGCLQAIGFQNYLPGRCHHSSSQALELMVGCMDESTNSFLPTQINMNALLWSTSDRARIGGWYKGSVPLHAKSIRLPWWIWFTQSQ